MVTTKWDRSGHLLYLKVIPSVAAPDPVDSQQIWAHLFTAAHLNQARFVPTDVLQRPIPASDVQAAWTGAYPDERGTPVRVEAASWHGRPVYFQIIPQPQDRTELWAIVLYQRLLGIQLGIQIMALAVSSILAWRNYQRRRGDRRGAFRIAVFIFATMILTWAFEANHIPDFAEFTLLFMRMMLAVFFALIFWTFYMALEPFVRRRWPHAIISWSRVLKGQLRDPVVGGDLLIGSAVGVAIAVLLNVSAWLYHDYTLRLPSIWVLAGAGGTLAKALEDALGAVGHCLTLVFFAFLFKVVLKREWPAVVLIISVAYVFQPLSPMSPMAVLLILAIVAAALLYLLLRNGLLSLIAAVLTFYLLSDLPIAGDFDAPGNTSSFMILGVVAVFAYFAFRWTVAGQRLWKLDF
jgi:serine/threonine-protein kinase